MERKTKLIIKLKEIPENNKTNIVLYKLWLLFIRFRLRGTIHTRSLGGGSEAENLQITSSLQAIMRSDWLALI